MDAKLKLAKFAIALGVLGFISSWLISLHIGSKVFSDPSYASKSAIRTELISVKGKGYFVETNDAKLYRYSQFYMLALGIALIGGAYVQKRERAEKRTKFESRRKSSELGN
ncbi:hypothetical protein [Novosphingobium sp.]|uniref:hypothetical protein n=1 Tax=Novosphingobium sp. TaxID=1874826 RepID=UPI00286D9B4C|nr:hypothetical protein [Novosphingobium sp.]